MANRNRKDTEIASRAAGLLSGELDKIRLRLSAHATLIRQKAGVECASGQGLYISDGEVEAILERPVILNAGEGEHCEPVTPTHCTPGPLATLQTTFGLTQFDIDVVLVCLLSQLFPDYAKAIAWLQDDVTRRRPGVDLLLALAGGQAVHNLDLRRRLFGGASLRDHALLIPALDPVSGRRGEDGYFELDPRIMAFILGSTTLDPRLAGVARLLADSEPEISDADHEAFAERMHSLLSERQVKDNWLIRLTGNGAQGCGGALARVLATSDHQVIEVDLASLERSNEDRAAECFELIIREANLGRAVLLVRDGQAPAAEGGLLERFVSAIDGRVTCAILHCTDEHRAPGPPRHSRILHHHIAMPDNRARQVFWHKALDGVFVAGDQDRQDLIFGLATKYGFTGEQIARAVEIARDRANWSDSGEPVRMADLMEACRDLSSSGLGALARRIDFDTDWDDLVLPPDRMQQLLEIRDQALHRDTVYERWNFNARIPYGRGLSVLFAGPSGTGKTLAAAILASSLDQALYRIDLSGVVSKYIGETEKNLERIFSQAESSNAILFFDEADALFGKRTEVKDAHDRYANIEVSYLLQRMEDYEGLVIMASNFRRNMDEAFVRRIRFTVDFPLPGAPERLRIWRRIWPAAAPLGSDVDLQFLADTLEISGAGIRNIALSAAFLAASDNAQITMSHILHAARREFQKMGKVLTKQELGNFKIASTGS